MLRRGVWQDAIADWKTRRENVTNDSHGAPAPHGLWLPSGSLSAGFLAGASCELLEDLMKLSPEQDCLVCEQCGKRGPVANTFQEMMRQAVQDERFGFFWEHSGLHTARFFCQNCKSEFDCEAAQ